MNSKKPSLFEVLINIIISFGNKNRTNNKQSLQDQYELAVALTLDTTLSIVYKHLNIERQTSIGKFSGEEISRLENVISLLMDKSNNRGKIAAIIGDSFEQLRTYSFAVSSDGELCIKTSPDRRGNGIYFTPVRLADATVQPTMELLFQDVKSLNDLRSLSIIDPAVGCGAFLLSTIRIGASILVRKEEFKEHALETLKAEIASNCIFGVDIDPLAIATTMALIKVEVGLPGWDDRKLTKHFKVADAIGSSLSEWSSWFPKVFPIGFSLVITNPPWSKLRPLRHEFFQHIDKRVRLYQGTELGKYLGSNLPELVNGEWSQYVEKTLRLSHNLKKSDCYSLNKDASGDSDLYKYFVERSVSITSVNGIIALLLPSGILRAQGSATLRNLFFSSGTIKLLIEYINKRRLFKIHSMYRFCSLILKKGETRGIEKAIFAEQNTEKQRVFDQLELSQEFLLSVGGENKMIPEVKTELERSLLYRIYQKYPTIKNNHSYWNFKFKRELDMTNDSKEFVSLEEAKKLNYEASRDGRWLSKQSEVVFLPVYEGRMVHQFDNCAKVYISGQGRSAKWEIPSTVKPNLTPHYFVSEDYATHKGWKPKERIGYCEISGHSNERTVLSAIIPAYSICGNKVPVLYLDDNSFEKQYLWLALANSIVVDWIMRRWISTTINHFYWQNIPLPSFDDNDQYRSLLINATKLLCEVDMQTDDLFHVLGQKALIRATIDAIVMALYEISEQDFKVLISDFPLISKSHLRCEADNISLTELVLRARRALNENKLDLNNLERTLGCDVLQAVYTYMPGEKAKQLNKTIYKTWKKAA